jgi:prevent-host-death family protein
LKSVSIRQAKAHLSRLVEEAAKGNSFIIAKAGKPVVKVTAVGSEPAAVRRLGFLSGQIQVPSDFDQMNAAKIERLFKRGDH